MEILQFKIEIPPFKNGDSIFQNVNSTDIFESKTNLPLYRIDEFFLFVQ